MRLQQLYDTEYNWSTQNKVLLKGEVAHSSDINRFKVGDGVSQWNDLPYSNNGLDLTKSQSISVTQDGGRTFTYTYDASSTIGTISVPSSTTSGQLQELIDKLPKVVDVTSFSLYIQFENGTHTWTNTINITGFNYGLRLLGNSSDNTKSSTKQVVINASTDWAIYTRNSSSVRIFYLRINFGTRGVWFENSMSMIRYCTLIGSSDTEGFGILSAFNYIDVKYVIVEGSRNAVYFQTVTGAIAYSTIGTNSKYGVVATKGTVIGLTDCTITGSVAAYSISDSTTF